MSIQKFRGATLEEALAQAEASLGPNPLIVSQSPGLKPLFGGATYCEVLAAPRRAAQAFEPSLLSAEERKVKIYTAPWLSPFELRDGGTWLFCGLSGAGKTSALVKLAAGLKQVGIPPTVVSRDYKKITGTMELANFARGLDLDFTTERRLPHEPRPKCLFVDTPGWESLPREEFLRLRLETTGARSVLVVDSTQQMATIVRSVDAFSPYRWDAFVITRWDLNEDWELVNQINALTGAPLLGISQSARFDVPFLTRDLSLALEPNVLSKEFSI